MKILDATCGFKGIWYQKNHPFVTFLDKRKEKIRHKTENMKFKSVRTYNINPDIVADWTKTLPFDDNYFDMVIFDPPHIVSNRRKKGNMESEYGVLYNDNWKDVLSKGIEELFRVLKQDGVFVFKWCETTNQTKIENILKLFSYKPLFGTRTGQANKNHWVLFLKYDVNMKLDKIQT